MFSTNKLAFYYTINITLIIQAGNKLKPALLKSKLKLLG
uniref:Uncharacterized protein n=1 Tax=Anguilla anguilla TaxID=7936 RepID=A0A0E9VBI3_ANGAN